MTIPLLGVHRVQLASKWLQKIFDWTSNHGGPHFEELLNSNGEIALWLHKLNGSQSAGDAHEHLRASADAALGTGVTFYVEVDDLEAVHQRCRRARAQIIEEIHFNENASLNEFTFRSPPGYVFTAYSRQLKSKIRK
ncbi:MAG: hypothetical protein H7222_15135 [Methylotenera sp.]|nr:hypothetical protein [Oligoflexia bacterium]